MGDHTDVPVVKTEVKQEFGTVWIEDVNGVSRMVRVLQVTPTKALAAGSGLVRAINTSGAGVHPAARTSVSGTQPAVRAAAPGSQPIIRASSSGTQPIIRASTSGAQPVMRASTSGAQPAVRASGSGAQPAVRPAGRATTVRVVQLPAAAVHSESPAAVTVNSPLARLQMQDRQQANLGTPGRQGSQQATHRTPTTGSGRLLLPAGGSPATPGSGPAAGTSGKRPGDTPHLWSDSKRRRYERNAKGLRHFSMKVCQKVREKGVTTYNEVADELVAELCPTGAAAAAAVGTGTSPDQQYEQKNIRRRVYDALNVLMAMQIISKERKQIKWLGLPATTVQEPPDCTQEEAECSQRIKEKTQQLKDLVLRQIAFKNLVERNRTLEEVHGPPEPSSSVQLPFIVVNTDKKTVIDCSISNDKTEYLFNFDDTFEIHDDIEVLQRMGMALGLENGTSTEEDLEKAKGMLPASLATFVDQVAREGAEAHAEDDPLLAEAALHRDPLQNLLGAEL